MGGLFKIDLLPNLKIYQRPNDHFWLKYLNEIAFIFQATAPRASQEEEIEVSGKERSRSAAVHAKRHLQTTRHGQPTLAVINVTQKDTKMPRLGGTIYIRLIFDLFSGVT